jgi:hypothetical protein
VRNCTRDEGGPLEAGSQVQASNHCKLLSSKAMVVSVAANVETMISAGVVERGERKQTADEVSKWDQAMLKPGAGHSSGTSSGAFLKAARAASGT